MVVTLQKQSDIAICEMKWRWQQIPSSKESTLIKQTLPAYQIKSRLG
jgi:hypothetical protein